MTETQLCLDQYSAEMSLNIVTRCRIRNFHAADKVHAELSKTALIH